jgi:presenilin-like A22 family membrane protease
MFPKSLWRSTAVSILVLPAFGVIASSAQTLADTSAQHRRIVDSYGRLPLSFEVNRGQTDKQVKFMARGSGYAVFLTGQEAVLALHASPSGNSAPRRNRQHRSSSPKTDVLQMQLLGANPSAEPQGADPLSGTVNYFRGNDPSRWQSGVPTFAKVEFAGVYPGVDLVYYGNQGQLEYDFVVAPNADPATIRLHFAGAGKLRLAATGDLTVRARNGKIAFHKPYMYQEEDGRRRPVQGRFMLWADNSVGFALGDYDHSRPLVIDPTLVYSTYLGGSTTDEAFGIAVDASGNTYITGVTSSADFPTTNGSYQTAQKTPGNTQAFITKLNSTGTALIYSTYLGGTDGNDQGNGIAVSAAGNAYITGYTESSDFPTTTGAFQTSPKVSGGTGFVTELNSTGSALVYSTYLGGSGGEQSDGIALNSSGDAYVVGSTQSADFPVTAGAFATTIPGFRSAFVTKLNSGGTALIYSTFLGGSGYDGALAIALDAAGNAYVVGGAGSIDFPVTASAFQKTSLTSPNATGFVAKLNPAGSALVYSTYLGGSTLEQVKAIAVDASDTAYVAGHTNSTDFPVTSGAFQGASKAGAGFVTHLNASGSALVYSTFLGPSSSVSTDGPHSIRVDSNDEAYVTGNTLPGFPVTPDAFQTTCSSLTSAFITRLNSTGTALVYSTCLGGTRGTFGDAIAINAAGRAFVAGGTIASDFPVTSGAFQTTNKTNNNFVPTGFVAAFDTNPAAAIGTTTTLSSSANPAALGQNVIFDAAVDASSGSSTPTGNVVFNIDGTNVATVALDTGSASYHTASLTAGDHAVKATYQGDSDFDSSSSAITETIQIPGASVTPGSLSFGNQTTGTTSARQSTTLKNTGNAALTISGITIAGANPSDFAQTNNCGSSLAAGSSCIISVTFTPASVASFTASLEVADNASGSPQKVTLSGTGTVAPAPVASLTPVSLSFSSVAGTTSPAQAATLKNTGNAALTISGITIVGANPSDFAQTNNCGASLAAGSSCNISVTFTPASAAAFTATLSVTDNASGSPHTVTLSGIGATPPAPVASLTPATLSFSAVAGTASAAQAATLKNTGNAALAISGITISGTNASDFSQTNTCGASLAAGGSCSISVTFTPASAASFTAMLSVADNAGGSPHTVTLSGAGTPPPAPVALLTPASLSFTAVSGATTAAQPVTLKNSGNAALAISGIAIGGTNPSDFAQTNDCGASLAAGSSCSISVTFTPASVSSFTATLSVTDNAGGSPQSITLSGTGTATPSFMLSSSTASESVQPGGTAKFNITVSAENGTYSNPVTFSASGLPAGASAIFQPSSITPGSSSATSVLTIQAPKTSALSTQSASPWPIAAPVLALVGFLFLPSKWRRRWTSLALLLFTSLGILAALSGCGGGFAMSAPKTYSITVSGTSGADRSAITIQLTVE